MRPTVFLFDVDGTLVTTGGVGRRAIVATFERLSIVAQPSFSFAGMTDRGIVRQALEEAGADVSEARIDALLEAYLEVLEETVARADAARYRVHRGIVAALDSLAAAGHEAIGLGTGNVERGARIKLRRVGLADRFAFGGFGCDAEARPELIRVGAERGAARLGLPRAECRVVVIGDTPRDVAAAKAVGAESVAVATGTIDRATLAACEPTFVFDDLAERGALEALLG